MQSRRNFSSSQLVRLLDDADASPHQAADASSSRLDVAERLTGWVGIFEASTLHQGHQSIAALAHSNQITPATPPTARSTRHNGRVTGKGNPTDDKNVVDVAEQLQQVRAILTRAITGADERAAASTGQRARHARMHVEQAPTPAPEQEADYAPYRQRYLDQQRQMDLMIEPLRDHVRQALFATDSAALRQLAGLDALWQQVLSGREQQLVATLPARLERRFGQQRKAHAQDDPATWRRPGGWLHAFGKEVQAVLLAELDTRLEPVRGLVEAFDRHQGKKWP